MVKLMAFIPPLGDNPCHGWSSDKKTPMKHEVDSMENNNAILTYEYPPSCVL